MIRLHKLLLLVAAMTASLSAGAAPLGDDEAVVEATDSVAEPGYNAYTGMPAVDAFINAPTAVFPSIDSMTRMDMADYFTSGSPKPSKNVFKGDCRIVSATPSQMTVTTTDASECELSLLPMAGDTIIMVVTTLQTPTPDSSVKFYTYPDWKPIEKELFIVHSGADILRHSGPEADAGEQCGRLSAPRGQRVGQRRSKRAACVPVERPQDGEGEGTVAESGFAGQINPYTTEDYHI